MYRRFFISHFSACPIAFLLIIFHWNTSWSAVSSRIEGVVKEVESGNPLPGANILIKGTALGAASDLDGRYFIPRVPPGSYTLLFSYIGFQDYTVDIQVKPNVTVRVDAELAFKVIDGEVITVTAQLEGQAAAINQQIRSNTITNIVSAERIMELPDANAAESVGRLPGISIKRSGGEGNQIVIRGLAPTYNSITIGGERIPATDLDDRSVDLNMISPEILSGIEVTKALTPDKDADAFGGTVNFKLADAPGGGFRYNFRFQEVYNDQRQEAGLYKGSMTLSNRYWNDKLGLMVTGNIERAQRGSDQFSAGYSVIREKREGEEFAPISVNNVTLTYTDELRKRSGFSVLMDYRLPNGKIMFSNFMSRLDRDENIIRNSYSQGSNWRTPAFYGRQRQIDILTNSLTGEHRFNFGNIDWRLSRSASLNRQPFENQITFKERSAFDQTQFPESYGPNVLLNAAYNNLDNTSLYAGSFYTEKSFERDYSAQFNLQIPYALTNKIAGYIKFGGKYVGKSKIRDRGYKTHRLDNLDPAYERHHTEFGNPDFEYQRIPDTSTPSVHNYIDENLDTGDFLEGEYYFGPGLDGDELNHLLNSYLLDSLYHTSSYADLEDYEVVEKVSAGYIMSEINIGRFLMFLPGVRYEQTNADMTGRKGVVPKYDAEYPLGDPFISDTTAIHTYGRWFPMIHTRIRPTKWFDIRVAYTKSLSRPPLDWILPKKRIKGEDMEVEFGRPDLEPQISSNYDVFLSIYSNSIGLFTIGGFYKEIEDLIFMRRGHKILNAAKEGFPKNLQGYELDRPENNPFMTKVKGWEVEWQTNFHWLPRPFDGLVLNANYTHIWSETRFPRSLVLQEKIPVFPYVETSVVDTFRTGDMPDQADDIANIAVGYDKGPFSARLSILYQGKTLTAIAVRPELDRFSADLIRMDLSVKYRLTRHIGLFFAWNNITNEPDESFLQTMRYPLHREFYSWTTHFGIGYEF